MLTVLSCVAGNARLRSALVNCRARHCLVDFGQRIPDARLRARSLSLVKVRSRPCFEYCDIWCLGSGANGFLAQLRPTACPLVKARLLKVV